MLLYVDIVFFYMLACILVEPESPGNIGSVARIMMNFDVQGPLILVNPPKLNDDAYMMACNARDILNDAVIVDSLEGALSMVDVSIATSREAGDEYNVNRISLLPDDIIRALDTEGDIGIFFGRESSGLSNREISMADILVSIPTDTSYPTLNLSHAAAIIFYEFFRYSQKEKRPIRLEGATRQEKDMIFDDFDAIVDHIEKRGYRKKISKIVFRRVISRSFISSREAYTLKGVVRNILKSLKD